MIYGICIYNYIWRERTVRGAHIKEHLQGAHTNRHLPGVLRTELIAQTQNCAFVHATSMFEQKSIYRVHVSDALMGPKRQEKA